MAQRLKTSSQSTISTAWNKHWLPFRLKYDLADYIESGDPNRGGEMASFVLELVLKQNLVFSSISGYVWGVVDKHLQSHRASPLTNVRDWTYFMHVVEVMAAARVRSACGEVDMEEEWEREAWEEIWEGQVPAGHAPFGDG